MYVSRGLAHPVLCARNEMTYLQDVRCSIHSSMRPMIQSASETDGCSDASTLKKCTRPESVLGICSPCARAASRPTTMRYVRRLLFSLRHPTILAQSKNKSQQDLDSVRIAGAFCPTTATLLISQSRRASRADNSNDIRYIKARYQVTPQRFLHVCRLPASARQA